MQTSKTRWLIAMLMALAMSIAACGSDDGSKEPAAPATETPAAPDEPAPEEEPAETTETPSDEPEFEPAPTPEPTPEIVLTATARGVTAETIAIGVTYLDIDQLVQLGFSPASWGDQELVIQALADDINNRGGINGRQVAVIMDKYSPIGATEAEAACLRVTEDNEVFAVLFGFLGPAEVANTCIVGQQETILVGGTINDERLAEARAPWATERADRQVIASALLTLLNKEGELQGRSIAVVADPPAADQIEGVVAQLRDLGVEPVLEITTSSAVADLIAQNQEWAALSERIRSAGTDTILLVGNPSAGIENAVLNGLHMDIWTTDASGLSNLGSSVDPESARGVITTSSMTGAQVYETDPRFKECLEAFNAAQPDIEVKHPDSLDEGEPMWFTNLLSHCRFFQLFELLATSAGPNLTHETFAQAIETIGEFSIASQPFASLGSGKYNSNDSFQLVSYNPDLGARGQLVPIGPMQDATP